MNAKEEIMETAGVIEKTIQAEWNPSNKKVWQGILDLIKESNYGEKNARIILALGPWPVTGLVFSKGNKEERSLICSSIFAKFGTVEVLVPQKCGELMTLDFIARGS